MSGRLLALVGGGLLILFGLVWWFGRVPAPVADLEPVHGHLRARTSGNEGDTPLQAERSPSPSVAPTSTEKPKFDPQDVLSWGGTDRNWFACMLEKKGYPAGHWGCQTPPWQGDPCRDEFLYTGPPFPDAMATQLSPAVEHVELKWDAGRIQRWEIALKPGSSEDDVRRDLRLPAGVPSDLMTMEFKKCPGAEQCLEIRAFNRMNCPGHRSEEE